MWVWYCRPPIGAHFHPTLNPHPFPSNWGRKRTYCMVCGSSFSQCDGQRAAAGGRPHIAVGTGDGACRRPPLGGRTRLVRCNYVGRNIESTLITSGALYRESPCFYACIIFYLTSCYLLYFITVAEMTHRSLLYAINKHVV